MKVQVNNKEMSFDSSLDLNRLAGRLELPEKGIAIAVNNRLVPRAEWESYLLQENDSVVIIRAACGG